MQCIWLSLLLLTGSAVRIRSQTCIASGAISDCNPTCTPPYQEVPPGFCSLMNLKCCKYTCSGSGSLCLPAGENCTKYGYTLQKAKVECKEWGVCCAEPKKPENWPNGYSWPPYSNWPHGFIFEKSYKLPPVWPRGWKSIPESAYPDDDKNTSTSSEIVRDISLPAAQSFQPVNVVNNAAPPKAATSLPTVKATTQAHTQANSKNTPHAQYSKSKPTLAPQEQRVATTPTAGQDTKAKHHPQKQKGNHRKHPQEQAKTSSPKPIDTGLPTQSSNPSAAGIPATQPQNPPESGVVPSQTRPTQPRPLSPSPDGEPNMSSSAANNNGSNFNNPSGFKIPQEASIPGGNNSRNPYAESSVPQKVNTAPPAALPPSESGTGITIQLSNNASKPASPNQSELGKDTDDGVEGAHNPPAVPIAPTTAAKPKIPQMSDSKKPQHTEIEMTEDEEQLKRPSVTFKQVEKTTNTKHHKHKLTYSETGEGVKQNKPAKIKKKKKRIFMIQKRHKVEKVNKRP